MEREARMAWLARVSAVSDSTALTVLCEEVARLPVGNERYQRLLDLLDHRYRVLPFMGYRRGPTTTTGPVSR
jgi:hypothetical protein